MPQFDVSSFSSQLFWLAIVFAALYFIVSRYIAPKAESILTARNRYMDENINYAEDYKSKANNLDIRRQEKFAEVNARVEEIQKQSVDTLEAHFTKQREELSLVLNNKKETALAEINKYVDKFHADEPDSCVSLAAFIILKVTNKAADLKHIKTIHGKGK
jgi:F-type H+-transporting ATPase subunit b